MSRMSPRLSLLIASTLAACTSAGKSGDDTALGLTDTSASACGASTTATGWSEASHQKGDADYDTVFSSAKVQRLDLTVCAEDFATMTADLASILGDVSGMPDGGPPDGGPPDGGPPDGGADGGGAPAMDFAEPVFVPATLSFDGKTWPSVGLRFKGNSSLMSSYQAGIAKLPLRLDMDQYEDTVPSTEDQRFYGFQKLSLGPGYFDTSYVREALTSELMDAAGLPVARTGFYELWIDTGDGPVYWGLYTMIEDPENAAFLKRTFGSDDGNLYQPEDDCADLTCFDEANFAKETNADAADWSDVEGLIAELALSDGTDAWRASFEQRFDVEGFLGWLALSTAIGNWDSYGLMPHNYFLYADPEQNGRLTWIPWDHNMAMSDGMMTLLSLDLSEVGEDWPLIRALLDDPVYAARYNELLAEQQEILDPSTFADRADTLHTLITPSVEAEVAPYTQLSDLDQFYDALDGADGLIPWMEARADLVEAYLGSR